MANYAYKESTAIDYRRAAQRQQEQEQKRNSGLRALPENQAVKQVAHIPYLKYAAIGLCVFAVLLAILSSYTMITELAYQNSDLRDEIETLRGENKGLQAKKEQMYNLTFVEQYAQSELGMVKMEQSDISYVDLSNPETMLVGSGEVNALPAWLTTLSGYLQAIVEYLR